MSIVTQSLLDQALVLPPIERAALAEGILSSLDRPDPAILKAWAAEAERRIELHEKGLMELIPEEEVFAEFDTP